MKLRTKFLLGVAILVAVLCGFSGLSLYTTFHVRALKAQQEIAAAIERSANDLSYVSNNYLLYREPSQLVQWESAFSSLQQNLARLRVDAPGEAALVASIKTNANRVQAVFRQIVSAVQAAQGMDPASERSFLRTSWSRVEVQNRQIVFEASRLDQLLARHESNEFMRATIVVFSLVGAFGLLILAGHALIYRQTLAGIFALRRGSEIVGSGDLDYRLPEDRRDELGDLSRAFNKMTYDLKSMGGMYRSQLHIASTLQQSLLDEPEHARGVDFDHLYRSATSEAAVGGDFYDVFRVPDQRIALLIGDVSGHGVEAARIATLVKDVVYAFTRRSSSPGEVVASTNELLIAKGIRGFVTLFIGLLDPDAGLLTYCSAGHPNAMVVAPGGRVQLLKAGSPPVGVFPEAVWVDCSMLLSQQELLFLYTDGLIEARKNGDFFGQNRLAEILKASGDSPERLVKEVLDAVLAFADGVLVDDVALLALRLIDGPPGRLARSQEAPPPGI